MGAWKRRPAIDLRNQDFRVPPITAQPCTDRGRQSHFHSLCHFLVGNAVIGGGQRVEEETCQRGPLLNRQRHDSFFESCQVDHARRLPRTRVARKGGFFGGECWKTEMLKWKGGEAGRPALPPGACQSAEKAGYQGEPGGPCLGRSFLSHWCAAPALLRHLLEVRR